MPAFSSRLGGWVLFFKWNNALWIFGASDFFCGFWKSYSVSDFRDFTERGFIYFCVCVFARMRACVWIYDGVCKKTETKKEMTKHIAEKGGDNKTKEQEKNKMEKEKMTKMMQIKLGEREIERNRKKIISYVQCKDRGGKEGGKWGVERSPDRKSETSRLDWLKRQNNKKKRISLWLQFSLQITYSVSFSLLQAPDGWFRHIRTIQIPQERKKKDTKLSTVNKLTFQTL